MHRLTTIGLALAGALAAAAWMRQPSADGEDVSAPADAADEIAVAEVVARLMHDTDARDWPAVRALFADTVDVDYTSLAGGEPTRMPADQLIASWRALLPGFRATQHLLGPIVVELDGDRATARSHVRATHVIPGAEGGESWVLGGHYTYRLVRRGGRWKIAATKLDVAYQEGNTRLAELARQRATSGKR